MKTKWSWIIAIALLLAVSIYIIIDLKNANDVKTIRGIYNKTNSFGKVIVNILNSNDNSITLSFMFFTNKPFQKYNISTWDISNKRNNKNQIEYSFNMKDMKVGTVNLIGYSSATNEFQYSSEPINLLFPFKNFIYPFGEQSGFIQINLIDSINKIFIPSNIEIVEKDTNLKLLSEKIVSCSDITNGVITGNLYEIRLSRPRSYAIISIIIYLMVFSITIILGIKYSKNIEEKNIIPLIGLLIGIPIILETTYIGPENSFTLLKLLSFAIYIIITMIIFVLLITSKKKLNKK